MAEKHAAISRRRSERRLAKKTFVYLTDEERRLIDQAAKVERRSVSSFVANAAIAAAGEVLSRQNKKK